MATSKIFPGADSNRMIDAVAEATRMLRTRPRNRQRIILLVGETRDISSETRLRTALMDIQVSNVMFYAVDMSRFITTLTAPPKPGRPDNRPPAMSAGSLPPGVPATPTTVAQATGGGGANAGRAEFIPLMVELFRDAKAIFKDNPVEAFTKATGGMEFGFHSQRTLEEAVQSLGEQLHSNYMISYSPNNRDEAGWHEITVDVPDAAGRQKSADASGILAGSEGKKSGGAASRRSRIQCDCDSTRRLLVDREYAGHAVGLHVRPCFYRPRWRPLLPASPCRYPR